LRFEADAGKGKDLVAFPEPSMAIDDHMRVQKAAGAQTDVFANHTIRTDLASRPNLCPRMNHRR